MPYSPFGETREKIYKFVRRRLEMGEPPTLREIQDEFGFKAIEGVRKHLEILCEEGRLIKDGRRSRAYKLPEHLSQPTVQVPLIGKIAEGGLKEAMEQQEGILPVEVEGIGSTGRKPRSRKVPELFALRVEDDGMTGVGIHRGDFLVAEVQSTARTGDVVVALFEDALVVRTLRRKGRKIELHAENSSVKPIKPASNDLVELLGKAVEVRRYLDDRRKR